MNVKLVLTSSVLVLIIASVSYLVFMNRASEKIVTAIIPITVAAIAGILLSIFVFCSSRRAIPKVVD